MKYLAFIAAAAGLAIFSVPIEGCFDRNDGGDLTACQYLGLHMHAYNSGCNKKYPATETDDYNDYLECLANFFGQIFNEIDDTDAYNTWSYNFQKSKSCEYPATEDPNGCLLDKCKGESDKCGLNDKTIKNIETWISSAPWHILDG